MGDPQSCSAGLGCDGICGSDAGPGTSGYLDECGECGGPGYNAGGCCGNDDNCLSYSTNIQPIFDANCKLCHGTAGGLNLTSYSKLMEGGNSGSVVIAGHGMESLIIKKMRDEDDPPMPNGNCCIDATLINNIESWIDQGAIESPSPSI